MQREIAFVMAACAMRGIRYIAFPPIVFEATAAAAVPEPLSEAVVTAAPLADPPSPLPEPVAAPPPPGPAPEPVIAAVPPSTLVAPLPPGPPDGAPDERPAAPGPAMRRLSEFATEAAAPPARLRRLTELSAADLEPPAEAATPRRYALLNDIAVELHPRRVRARSGKRPWP